MELLPLLNNRTGSDAMNKTYLILVLVLSGIFTVLSAQNNGPQLIYPENNSEYQRSKNLEFKWAELPSVTTYRFELSSDSSFYNPELFFDVMGNSVVIDLLEYDSLYYWRVRDLTDETGWSEKWSFRTTIPPVRPQLILPVSGLTNQPDSMTFAWNKNIANSGYILQFSLTGKFSGSLQNIYVSDTTYRADSLQYSRPYYWRVRALNVNMDESTWSEARFFKTRLPGIKSLIADSTRNVDTALTIQWSKIDSATHYAFRVSTDRTLLDQTSPVILTGNKYLLDSLDANSWYYWQVLAFNTSGDSSLWSQVYSFRTKLRDINITSPVKGLRNTDTTMNFVWQPVQFSERYRFQLALDNQFTMLAADTILKNVGLSIDSLQYGTTYYWRINAYNKFGDSSKWSGTYSFRTRLSMPHMILPANDTNDVPINAEFRWSSSPGATYYKIQVSNEPEFDYPSLDTSIARNSYKFKLVPDTLYYWRIRAYNLIKDSSLWSPVQAFRSSASYRVLLDSVLYVKNLSEDPDDTLGYFVIENMGVNSFEFQSIYIKPDTLFQLLNSELTVNPENSRKYWVKINTAKIPAGTSQLNISMVRRNIADLPDTLSWNKSILIRKAVAKIASDTLVFRNTASLDSSLKSLVIKNVKSNIPLKIKKVSISGSDTLSFSINNKLTYVPANDSLPLNIWFKPTHQQINEAFLKIETNSFPVRDLNILLRGSGRGGELAEETYNSIKHFAADSFETFTDNSRKIFFRNTGNEILSLSLRFKKNYFRTVYDFQKDIQLKAGDTMSVQIKYNTPNFRRSNIDTLEIIHRGFGKDSIIAVIKGTFDSTASSAKLYRELLLNNEPFPSFSGAMEKNTALNFTHNPDLFKGMTDIALRLKYYTGGNGSYKTVHKDFSGNYRIPSEHLNQQGLLVWGELFIQNGLGKYTDSIIVLQPADVQVILRKFETVSVSVPKSIPVEDKADAKTKWIMFGFPFKDVIADSVFGRLGGASNQKDGEWIIYRYNPDVSAGFSIFDSYTFEPLRAYFFAQALTDSFRISYKYPNNVLTRKLTDTVINVSGSGWKTISNPFLFDVLVDNSVTLTKYDVNYNSYRMVNYMKPGEAYFVAPEINQVRLKTFGKYDALRYPGPLKAFDWNVKISGKTESSVHEVFVTMADAERLSKSRAAGKYTLPPSLSSETELYLVNEQNEKLLMNTARGTDGAVWDLIIKSASDQNIILTSEINGTFPESFGFRIYSMNKRAFINFNEGIALDQNTESLYKIIIGTEKYIGSVVNSLSQLPEEFSLYQNYPNPFNSSTTISYVIPSGISNERVTLKLYDVLGREAATIVDEVQNAGRYNVKVDLPLSSGIYIYKLSAGSFSQSRKMVLLK